MNNKKTIYGIIFILICLVGIGYAALVSNINIIGTAKMKANTFDVHFENITLTNGSVEINTTAGDSAATIEPTNRTKVDYSVTLEKPGDFYEFTVKVVNGGGMDAMINTVTSKMNNVVINNNLPNYLEYNVTYEDGIAIANNHMLNSGEVETYKVRVAYRTDINPSDLPTTPSTTTFSFSVNYIQKDSNAITRPVASTGTYIYKSDYYGIQFNSSISSIVGDIYYTEDELVDETGNNIFLRGKIEDDEVSEISVGYKYNGNYYYLICGASEGKIDPRPIYKANKDELDKAFGASNCSEDTSNAYYDFYECSNDSWVANTRSDSYIFATDGGWNCIIDGSGGNNYCYSG